MSFRRGLNPLREGRTIGPPLSEVRVAGRPGTRKECVRAMRDPLPHVLVVDDDASIREALGAALGHAYTVHAAATGDEACAVLRRHPIAAIIPKYSVDSAKDQASYNTLCQHVEQRIKREMKTLRFRDAKGRVIG